MCCDFEYKENGSDRKKLIGTTNKVKIQEPLREANKTLNQIASCDCRALITFFCPTLPIPANQLPSSSVTSSQCAICNFLNRVRSNIFLLTRRRVVIMSDVQQYLLDYDRNKKEATETAQRSATRTFGGAWRHGRVLMACRIERWTIEAHKSGHGPRRISQQRRWRDTVKE